MKKTQIKPIADQFNYRVFWSEEDSEYVAIPDGYPWFSWLDPDQKRALKGLKRIMKEEIAELTAAGERVPCPGQMPRNAKVIDRQLSN